MTQTFDKTLRKILEEAASSSPTPGGGSISAMAGALGVSMAAMVGNLTIHKEKYKDVEAQAGSLTQQAYAVISQLEAAVNADILAFNNYMEVYRLPQNSEEEKNWRRELLQKALIKATNSPMNTARLLIQALSLTKDMAEIGNKMVISDAGVAAYICEGAIKSVLLNVDINVPHITDKGYVQDIMAEMESILSEAAALRKTAVETVIRRMG